MYCLKMRCEISISPAISITKQNTRDVPCIFNSVYKSQVYREHTQTSAKAETPFHIVVMIVHLTNYSIDIKTNCTVSNDSSLYTHETPRVRQQVVAYKFQFNSVLSAKRISAVKCVCSLFSCQVLVDIENVVHWPVHYNQLSVWCHDNDRTVW